MRRLAAPRAVLAGCGLVLAVNAAMLALSAWNRAGGPQTSLALTERELRLPMFRERENSSLTLTLASAVGVPPAARRAALRRGRELAVFELPWLDRAKLRELGFREAEDPPRPDDHAHGWIFERRVFVVLEFEGAAWRSWIAAREAEVAELRERGADAAEVEAAEALLAHDRTERSRLVPIDAGTDPGELRRRHADRERSVVLPAVIDPRWSRGDDGALVLVGGVRLVPGCRVTVPASLRPVLEPFVPDEPPEEAVARERAVDEEGWPPPSAPRYRATLAFGRAHFAWLVAAEAL